MYASETNNLHLAVNILLFQILLQENYFSGNATKEPL